MSWTLWKERFSKGSLLVKNDPELLFSMVRSKVQTNFFPSPTGKIIKQIGEVEIELDLSRAPQSKAMYYDAYEPTTMKIMKKCLKPGDTFIDVGASIGYVSAVAANCVGKRGQVHSFEPSPRDFKCLQELPLKNPDFKIFVNPCALGEEACEADLDISSLNWIGWNTMVPGFMRKNVLAETAKVSVMRLDDYLQEHSIKKVSLIKIDTEGYEFKVLKGLQRFFESSPALPLIICEVTPRVHALLGTSLEEMSAFMKGFGYCSVSLLDQKTEVDLTQLKSLTDVLFVPGNLS